MMTVNLVVKCVKWQEWEWREWKESSADKDSNQDTWWEVQGTKEIRNKHKKEIANVLDNIGIIMKCMVSIYIS